MKNVKKTFQAVLTIVVVLFVLDLFTSPNTDKHGSQAKSTIDQTVKQHDKLLSQSNPKDAGNTYFYKNVLIIILAISILYYLGSNFYIRPLMNIKLNKINSDKLIENYTSYRFDKDKKKEFNILKPDCFRKVNLEKDPIIRYIPYTMGTAFIIVLIIKNLY